MDTFTPFDELLVTTDISDDSNHPLTIESDLEPKVDGGLVDSERYGAGTTSAFCVVA